MKLTSRRQQARRIVAFTLTFAAFANSALLVFAAPEKNSLRGEIVVFGRGENGAPPMVKVNGERTVTGRAIPSYSMIETLPDTSADINLSGLGRLGLSPNAILILSFAEKSISGKLLSGKLKVFVQEGVSVKIETPDNALSNDMELPGSFTIDVQAGITRATAESGVLYTKDGQPAGQAQTTGSTGNPIWIPATVFAAIVGTAVIAVLLHRDSDDAPGLVVSPVR